MLDVHEQVAARVLNVKRLPGTGQQAASSAPRRPGSSSAVAALTAPSTPIAVCGRTGMNVRVQIVAAVSRAAHQRRLGHRGMR